jgi:hypothetical protein
VANASFTTFRDGILTGKYDLSVASIKVALIKGYTFTPTHTFMSEVTGAGASVNAVSAKLANPTVTGGVFDADDTTLTTTTDATPHTLIAYQASAPTGGADIAATAQRVMWYFDTGTGLPVTPGAGTLTVTWPAGAAKIYKIG